MTPLTTKAKGTTAYAQTEAGSVLVKSTLGAERSATEGAVK